MVVYVRCEGSRIFRDRGGRSGGRGVEVFVRILVVLRFEEVDFEWLGLVLDLKVDEMDV